MRYEHLLARLNAREAERDMVVVLGTANEYYASFDDAPEANHFLPITSSRATPANSSSMVPVPKELVSAVATPGTCP